MCRFESRKEIRGVNQKGTASELGGNIDWYRASLGGQSGQFHSAQAVGSFGVFVISISGPQLVGFRQTSTLRPTEAPTTARLAKMSPFRDGEEPPSPSDAAI